MSFDQILQKRGVELPNFDKNTGIFYGVIGFNEMSPYALDDILIEARDLTWEDGLKKLNDDINTIIEEKDLRAIFDLTCDIFTYGTYKSLYGNAKICDWHKRDIEAIKEVLSLFKSGEFQEVINILEMKFNDSYESDEPNILYEYQGYQIINGNSFTLMVIKSPYYCFAPECSPCYPCAGNLGDIREDRKYSKKTYCLDSSFFEESDKPKYKIYEVKED